MSSSDTEDDCYGNIAQKLQTMKNKYVEDKVQSTKLLDESIENKKKRKDSSDKQDVLEVNASIISTDNEELTLDTIIANNSKRRKRSCTKNNVSVVDNTTITPKRNTRKKNNKNSTNKSPINTNVPNAATPGRRGRGRRNTRRARNMVNVSNSNYPTFSVGNTDEYPDQSDNQQLFTTNSDVVIIDEHDSLDDNEELSVKVYWQNSEFFKFPIRRYQKLTQIFDYFSTKDNVNIDKLFFTYNERVLTVDDTPDSIDYSIVKFIDGGIVNQSVSRLVKKDKRVENGIRIKFQCQNMKKPFETTVKSDETLSLAMMKCAEHLEIPLNRLKFQFDGDSLAGKNTAKDLDLEGGECIDVRIIS